jgi:RNA polymerase primary sigma factor
VSLAAMEAELKPHVLETFDRIAKTYKKLRKLQDQEVAEKTALSPSQKRRYKKLREEIIDRCEVAVAQRSAHRGAG